MIILLLGASGFIGAATRARLAAEGTHVVAVARRPGPASPNVEWRRLDLRHAVTTKDWAPLLGGITAVINCAGVLQDSPRDSTQAVHVDAPAALFEACARAGVRRFVQVSAMGVDRGGVSPFSQTKHDADSRLAATDLDWVILRPSVVVGRPAYGGSALFRGLAALPFAVKPVDAGLLQIVQLDEVVETIVQMVRPEAPARVAVEIAGPERLTLEQVVAAYRRWLGWKPAVSLGGARPLLGLGYAAGDFVGLLGWRSPIRSTARKEISRGAVGDPAPWMRLTGLRPRSLDEALAAEPASVQERWFARLFLLKPVVLSILSLFWLGTGAVSLTSGFSTGVQLMEQAGADRLSSGGVVAGALADLLIGGLIAYRPTTRLGLNAALAVSIFYLVAATVLAPSLWADPLGSLTKIIPILALNLVALAILDDR